MIKYLRMLLFLSTLSLMLVGVKSHNGGAPSSACDSMVPNHPSSAQTTTSPYTISLSKTTYSPNDHITVSISGTGGNTFQGFFVQPRSSLSSTDTIGTFDVPANTNNPCTPKAALTHSNSGDKQSISFTWNAPSSDQGPVIFVYTVVKVQLTYWVKLQSETLTFEAAGQTTTQSSIATTEPGTTQSAITTTEPGTTQSSITTREPGTTLSAITTTEPGTTQSSITTTEPGTTQSSITTTEPGTTNPSTTFKLTTRADNSGLIARDSACGHTKGCFPSIAECSTDCDYLITWTDGDSDDIIFSMKRKATGDSWVAVGLSATPTMYEASVMECISTSGVVVAQSSYNPAMHNEVLSNPQYGITLISSSHENGIIACTIRRKKSASLVNSGHGRRKRVSDGDGNTFFDLETDWYMLVAHGTASGGVKNKHQQTPIIFTTKVDFQNITESPQTTTEAPVSGAISKDSGCGDSMGCFSKCSSDTDCDFVFTWNNHPEAVDFTITCKRSGNGYCAFGMSRDRQMGDDSVLQCVSNGDDVVVSISYNGGKDNSRLDDPFLGLAQTSGSIVDGVLSCTFSRMKTMALASAVTGRRKRAAVQESTYFDLNDNYYLLHAYGDAIGGFISKHSTLPLVSSEQADFQSTMDLTAPYKRHHVIIVHGVLMVVAWMLLASVGIITARFYRSTWQDDATLCGEKPWFTIYRTCMIAAFLCCVGGFVIIFFYVKGYSEITGSHFSKSHPSIGIVVMVLIVINAVMATFRCDPGTSERTIFNRAHWFVETAAYICAIINIFSASTLVSASLPGYTKMIILVFVGWILVIVITLHIHDFVTKNKKKDTSERYELSQKGSRYELTTQRAERQTLKLTALGLHVLIVIALSVAVCVIVAVGTRKFDSE